MAISASEIPLIPETKLKYLPHEIFLNSAGKNPSLSPLCYHTPLNYTFSSVIIPCLTFLLSVNLPTVLTRDP